MRVPERFVGSRPAIPARPRRTPGRAPPVRRAGFRGRGSRCGPGAESASISPGSLADESPEARRASRDPGCPGARAGTSRRRRASAASVCQSTPITSAPVWSAISSSAHPAPGAKAMTGAPASRAIRGPGQIGEGELAEIRGAQRAGPGIEELNRLGARLTWAPRKAPTVRARRASSPCAPAASRPGVAWPGRKSWSPALDHVAHQGPRRAGEPDEWNPAVQLPPGQAQGVEHVAVVLLGTGRAAARCPPRFAAGHRIADPYPSSTVSPIPIA